MRTTLDLRARTLALLLATLVVACHKAPTPTVPRLASDAKVLAFGDSLTYGTGASPGHSYPEQLQALIGHPVINAGVPGETTSGGRERLAAVLDEQQPALVILCEGGNDMLRQEDRKQQRANLDAMIQEIRGRGIAVVLLAVPEPKIFLGKAEPMYAELAKQYRLPVDNDVIPDVEGNRSRKSDQIHPNDEGYKEMAQAVARLLRAAGAV